MGYEIGIINGPDERSYFWFRPVALKDYGIDWEEGVVKFKDVFSIEETDVYNYLLYFLEKYFDEELNNKIRRNRIIDENTGEVISDYVTEEGFYWWLTENFYTYDTLNKMVQEISQTADMLKNDYDNPALDVLKERFEYLIIYNTEDYYDYIDVYCHYDKSEVEKYKGFIIDFYRRFVRKLTEMMNNNSQTDIIAISGP